MTDPAMTDAPTVVPITDVVLETRGLTKSFRGFTAVRDLDFTVRRGTIHALIGPNGAGKTTVFNLLTKFLAPTSGHILHDGVDITAASPAAIARRGIGRSFQISATFPHLTALENVRVALQRRTPGRFHFWRPESTLAALNDRALALLAEVGLEACAHEPAGTLPYGAKKALEIATTLALDPDVLLLDEPLAGMGREDVARTAALIRRTAQKENGRRTVVMVEHNLGVVADLSDRITVLQRGEILAEGSYADIAADRAVREAYMGTGHA
ncbi:ABC transporter ATP-binding protein [Nitrospirillum viridazoti]|uniref:Amino acid/amide ABC transporter ATP-binding protein 1 (HAAT family) n=1 Tax=Nitrospirillum amazonense TaxID=28077 RepID=A0A560I6B4_9PROT|nr:ABC transporter ATP-binding protein [Nitrospirillum amazonense]TWB52704.1 amino acid/amide ABC transporter ATP-binding protein 1 (HAAT family) [Nitrospirillum amazonense]